MTAVDVLVVGGGMAGTLAALAARRAGAKRVAVASRAWGATAMATGGLDIAFAPALRPAAAATPKTLRNHVEDIARHRPRHPYGVMGVATTCEALLDGFGLLAGAVSPALQLVGAGGGGGGGGAGAVALDLDRGNLALPSALGTLVPTAVAWGVHGGLDFACGATAGAGAGASVGDDGRPWGVLGLGAYGGFDADRLAAGWRTDSVRLFGRAPGLRVLRWEGSVGGAGAVGSVDGSADGDGWATLTSVALARRLDDPNGADRAALLRGVAAAVRGQELAGLVLPPVLGLRAHADVLKAVQQAAGGVPVIEALGFVPSVPGVRLQLALEAALDEAGVARMGAVQRLTVAPQDGRVVSATVAEFGGDDAGADAEPRGEALNVDGDADVDLDVRSVVLATGRFVAGGVAWGAQQCCEPLLDLPLVTELGPLSAVSPHPVVRPTPVESHPLMTAGVHVGAPLQPLRDGVVAHPNVWAAGMLLGGFASRYALSADGVAMATGALAGAAAGRAAVGAGKAQGEAILGGGGTTRTMQGGAR